MSVKKIAVIGAGNGGHAIAAHKSLDGFEVSLFELPRFAGNLRQVLDTGEITIEWPDRKESVKIHQVTTNIANALEGAEIIFVVTPAFGHKSMAELCAPHVEDGQIIILMPGSGGSLEFAGIFKARGVDRDVLLGESCTLPYGARLAGPGHVLIHIEAVFLPTGVFPANRTGEAIARLQEVYPTIVSTSNVLEAALNNPNPIVHPVAALLSVSRIEYSGGEFYLYQEGMTPAVARVYEALERERLAILNRLDLKFHHYAGLDARNYNLGETIEDCHGRILNTTMDAAFGADSIKAGMKMKGPASMQDRFVTEDVPYGLLLLSTLGQILNVRTPSSDAIVNLCGVINRADYWAEGRGVDELGLGRMSLEQIRTFLETGV
ncbi:MAG: dehydrogenase [bacterium]|nr:dehydrogenase [bacterium]